MRKRVAVIGSTGSIGVQALDVIRKKSDELELVALAAACCDQLLMDQIQEFQPAFAAVADEGDAGRLASCCVGWSGAGMDAVTSLSALPEVDQVLIAVAGAAGILPTYEAVKAGKQVALANKESLVAAGDIIMPAAKEYGAVIVPVDSEHSAIFQCLRDEARYAEFLWLTASGGPFRRCTLQELQAVTVEMALRHPRWNMGPKITIDSATLMNKGLEVIEAHHLFQMSYDKIKVVIHPESIIHSMVEFTDGSYLAHLGVPDMRIPIQYAFSYPARWQAPCERLDLIAAAALHFEAPDTQRFPALALALDAGRTGGTMPAVMNAANEIAVQSFLKHRLAYTVIPEIVGEIVAQHTVVHQPSMDDILAADRWARTTSTELIERMRESN